MDLDQSGNPEQVVRVNLGPTLGWVNVRVNPSQSIMSGGTYAVAPGTGVVLVDSMGTVTINLPDVRKWVQETSYMPATGFERAIVVKDLGGNAATANIIVTSASGQFIDKTFASITMAIANEVLCLLPLRDMSGWYNVSSGVGSGGGGGGGGGTTTAATDMLLYSTPAVASVAVIPDTSNFISVAGNSAPDDGGAGVYARVSSLAFPYVGTGFTSMVPPSFTSGVVPELVYATTAANATVGSPGWGPSIKPIHAGSLALIIVFDYGVVPSTATDSAGNTYTMAVDFGTNNGVGAILYCLNPVFAPTGTTFAIAGRTGPGCLYVYTVSGFNGATLDVTKLFAGAPVTTASPSLATGPLSTQPELVIGMMSNGANPILLDDVPINYTMAPGWIDLSPPIHSRNAIACAVATSTAGLTFNPTWSNGANPSNGVVATFKTFPRPALDASYWQLLPPVPLHTRHFGIDPTSPDNVTPFQFFSQYLATTAAPSGGVGAERAGTPQTGTVTISIANPAVITVTSPTFQQPSLCSGSAISFQTTGALPTGIVANQIYYVLYGTVKSILATGPGSNITFQITSTPLFNGTSSSSTKGTAIATTGTQSGTHSITTYGESWTDFVWDPGSYAASNNMAPGINAGLKKTRILAYGTRIATNINFYGGADRDQNANTGTSMWCYHTQFQTTDVDTSGHQQNFVTLITPAQAVNFYPNSWVALMAVDMQQNAGANWNPSTFEFLRIESVDVPSGTITFYDRMQYNYRSTLPKFTPGTGIGWSGSVDGPATIVQLNDGFDQELEVRGLNIYGVTEGTIGGMKTVRLVDCVMNGWAFDSGPSPANVRNFTMERCTFHNCTPEVDKMIDTLQYIDCVFDENSYPRLQTASVNKMVITRCKLMSGLTGTGKETVIKDSFITKQLQFGPVYGATDRVTLINSYIGETTDGLQEGSTIGVNTVTFTSGTLSVAVGAATTYGTWRAPGGATAAVCPLPWAVPGAKIAINSSSQISTTGATAVVATSGLIKAFTVLDVYMDGSNAFSVDTDLTALPDTALSITASVAGNTLTVTAITPSDANLLIGMTITGGGLPAGTTITNDTPGIPRAGTGTYTISNSATIASTTFTATLPMVYSPHPCARLTVINCTGGRTVADMAGAPPDIPIYSYFRRAISGGPINVGTSEKNVRLAGNLLYLDINVLRPYTGAAASYLLTLALFGYKTASGKTYPFSVSQIVNLKTVGLRHITAAAITGNVAGDTIVAVPFWLTGGHAFNVGPTAGGGDTLAMAPYFTITAQADQGIYPSLVLNAHSGVNEFADTVTQANALW